MDPARSVDTERLKRDIDETRASISGTVGELRHRAGEAMRWQTYVERHATPLLATSALLGFVVGRWVGTGLTGGRLELSTRLERAGDTFTAPSKILQRLDSRIEALANRVIDEVANTTERALVPALVASLQTLFEGRRAHEPGRPAAGYNAAVATAEEGRFS